MRINIIGDIAGRYDELHLLLMQMPQADLILSVGDMVDRGPKSKQVVQWFMKEQKAGRAEALYGNHEDMMVQGCTKGGSRDWMHNGGYQTLVSYMNKKDYYERKDVDGSIVTKSHIEWLQKRPMYFQTDDLFVSHAPITSLKNIPKNPHSRDFYFMWNRYEPSKPQDKFLINGHNGSLKEYKWGDGRIIGMCIDDSYKQRLTGLHWPTKEIFQVDYLPVVKAPQRELTEEEKKEVERMTQIMSCFV